MGIFDDRKKAQPRKMKLDKYDERLVEPATNLEIISKIDSLLIKKESILKEISSLIAVLINNSKENRNVTTEILQKQVRECIKPLNAEEKVFVLTGALVELFSIDR